MHKHPTSGQTEIAEGMDLRDWFAGQVLQGLLSHTDTHMSYTDFADNAYVLADLMMKRRKEFPNE
jgi:hypothetical protein